MSKLSVVSALIVALSSPQVVGVKMFGLRRGGTEAAERQLIRAQENAKFANFNVDLNGWQYDEAIYRYGELLQEPELKVPSSAEGIPRPSSPTEFLRSVMFRPAARVVDVGYLGSGSWGDVFDLTDHTTTLGLPTNTLRMGLVGKVMPLDVACTQELPKLFGKTAKRLCRRYANDFTENVVDPPIAAWEGEFAGINRPIAFGQIGEHVLVVMEKAGNWDLDKYMANTDNWKKFSSSEDHHKKNFEKIALDLVQGLRKFHEHGLTHKDLKPGNVMITVEETTVVAISEERREEFKEVLALNVAKALLTEDAKAALIDEYETAAAASLPWSLFAKQVQKIANVEALLRTETIGMNLDALKKMVSQTIGEVTGAQIIDYGLVGPMDTKGHWGGTALYLPFTSDRVYGPFPHSSRNTEWDLDRNRRNSIATDLFALGGVLVDVLTQNKFKKLRANPYGDEKEWFQDNLPEFAQVEEIKGMVAELVDVRPSSDIAEDLPNFYQFSQDQFSQEHSIEPRKEHSIEATDEGEEEIGTEFEKHTANSTAKAKKLLGLM